MPLSLQGKLLRVFQEKKIRRVGSLENIPFNCKVICSVNENPKQLVKSGKFRMDLFYRLAVVFIHIPALRDRLVDIEELGRHFLQKYNDMLGKNLSNISPEVIDFFWRYSWPGNVRELQHIIESAVNMASEGDHTLDLDHCYITNLLGITDIPKDSWNLEDTFERVPDYSYPGRHGGSRLSLSESAAALESKNIVDALALHRGNIAAAARDLSISRQLLNYKVKKHGLRPLLEELRAGAKN